MKAKRWNGCWPARSCGRWTKLTEVSNRDRGPVLAEGRLEKRVLGHLDPRRNVPGERFGRHQDRGSVVRASGHLPFAVVQRVVATGGIPEAQVAQVRFVQALRIRGRVAAEVEAVAHRGELSPVGNEKVERGADGDAELLARIADDVDGALDGDGEPVGAWAHVRLAKLGNDEGVDPFAVRGVVDLGED